jgi:hypothetical protein
MGKGWPSYLKCATILFGMSDLRLIPHQLHERCFGQLGADLRHGGPVAAAATFTGNLQNVG